MTKYFILFISTFIVFTSTAQLSPATQYAAVQKKLQSGWGTYNHKSVLCQVLLPYGFALNLGFKVKGISTDGYLHETYIGSRNPRPETIVPGLHAPDGSYTDLSLQWKGISCRVQTATTGSRDIVILITPQAGSNLEANLVVEGGMLWNKPGTIIKKSNVLMAGFGGKAMQVHTIGTATEEFIAASAPYLAVRLDTQIAVYTGVKQTLASIQNILAQKRENLIRQSVAYGNAAATFLAIQNVACWNIIYDAAQHRVIVPVSRLWNDIFGGQSVLFDWDTYFGAYLASLSSKELAYANAIEITKTIKQFGFVPNWSGSYRLGSFDRSQPPVGSFVIKELYRKYKDKWLLNYVFNDLLTWNRWWTKNRDDQGWLCWGSNPVLPPLQGDGAAHEWQGAAYESGLDNSPMYDSVPFNKNKNMLSLADAGLMGMYVMDCDALAQIATVLQKTAEAKELVDRGTYYRTKLQTLWQDSAGIFLNKRTDAEALSHRLSPTNFYPLLANAATPEQANRMMHEHLLNPLEFNGKWMLPSISQNDPAFTDQKYWRGRIWAPLNFLVYLGMTHYDLGDERKQLADNSNRLFMANINSNGYVFENYNAITGNVTDPTEGRKEGDNYYHWGALLGFIYLMDKGFVADPSKPIN